MLESIINTPALSMAMVAIMGALAYTIKDLPTKAFNIVRRKVMSRFLFTVRIPDFEDLFPVFEKWLFDTHKQNYRDVHACFSEARENRIPNIIYKSAPNIFTIIHQGKRILIEKRRQSIDHAQDFRSLFAHEYIITGIRAQQAILSLLEVARNSYFSHIPKNAVTIRTHRSGGYFESSNTITVKPIDKVIIDQVLKDQLLNDLNEFRNGRERYLNNCIPYKRGYCFYGPPGTGKTSLSLAIASYLEADVYVININSLVDDSALQTAFQQVTSGAVLLLEDIDAAFSGRTSKCNVSFSALLNCLDGAFYREGLISCITTNHLSELDPALVRSGRCDLKLEVPYPTHVEVSTFLSQFYGRQLVFESDVNMAMADVQEICITHKNDPEKAIRALRQSNHLVHTTKILQRPIKMQTHGEDVVS